MPYRTEGAKRGDPALNNRAAVENDIALDVSELTFEFPGKLALDQVSLSVPYGRFSVLLGANGAGKTTLYSLVTGLYSPRSGEIEILGHNLRRQASRALAGIGVVFQRPTLDLDLTVLQNLRYFASLQGLSGRDSANRIRDGLARHQLEGFIDKKINQLSGGERRRVELVRALLHQPKLLLMDEPTVGLDIRSRSDFLSHVRSLCRNDEVGVLWATHLTDEVERSDHLFVLHQGRMIASGVVVEILDSVDARDVGEAFKKLTRDKT